MPTAAPPAGGNAARLQNISTRLRAATGDNVVIAGFIISGTSPKKVMVRGRGPSVGLGGALADPTLRLFIGDTSISNDDWRSSQEREITAAGLAPTSPLESAIVATLNPGAYTAIMEGKGNTSGVGLVEVYDLEPAGSASLANISTRGVVQTGDNVMIAGFILGGGTGSGRVVVRARGESLAAAGDRKSSQRSHAPARQQQRNRGPV